MNEYINVVVVRRRPFRKLNRNYRSVSVGSDRSTIGVSHPCDILVFPLGVSVYVCNNDAIFSDLVGTNFGGRGGGSSQGLLALPLRSRAANHVSAACATLLIDNDFFSQSIIRSSTLRGVFVLFSFSVYVLSIPLSYAMILHMFQ